jgi:hypothetical protein
MLAACLLHPIQLEIVEAMLWVDRPLSVSVLIRVFDGRETLSTIAYHVRRLNELGALRLVAKRQPPRGTEEKFYRLSGT